jgi:hypothetical protein
LLTWRFPKTKRLDNPKIQPGRGTRMAPFLLPVLAGCG